MDKNQLFSETANDIYSFAFCMHDYMKIPRDYGTGEILNMVEIHTLSMIADHPGICVSDVARQWNRTTSAASRNINKLEQKGYVIKKKLDGNDKNVHLFPTSTGLHLANLHSEFDKNGKRMFMEFVKKRCTDKDVEIFNNTLRIIQEFFQKAQS